MEDPCCRQRVRALDLGSCLHGFSRDRFAITDRTALRVVFVNAASPVVVFMVMYSRHASTLPKTTVKLAGSRTQRLVNLLKLQNGSLSRRTGHLSKTMPWPVKNGTSCNP